MKTARKVVSRRIRHRPAPPTLSQRIERLERKFLFETSGPAAGAAPRFVNLGADGKPTTKDHVAVLQTATGLIWSAAPLNGGEGLDHADAIKATAELDLLGHKDWRLATIQELLSIIDYERWNPAVDPAHFKGPYGWTWTSTLVKGDGAPSGGARSVGLEYGGSYWLPQGSRYQALAVRASQQLGLLG
jgi:hypothetical protein